MATTDYGISGFLHGTFIGNAKTYTVQSGDTLYVIARAAGLTLQQLLALNPQIKNANLIDVGQVINLKGTTTVITDATPTPNGTVIKTSQTETPQNTQGFFDQLSKGLGVGTYVLGVAGFAVLLILLVPRKK